MNASCSQWNPFGSAVRRGLVWLLYLVACGFASGAQAAETVHSRGLRPPPTFPRPQLPPVGPNGAIACAVDQGDPQGTMGRDLSGFMTTDPAMTNAQCKSVCAARGFVFSGTQVGNYCFCGNSFGRTGLSTNCGTRCPGNLAEICGGIWSNSVSTTGLVPTVTAPPANGGQCVFNIQGEQHSGALVTNYRHTEIQRWVVAATPSQSGPVKSYAVQWTTTGTGEKHEDNGVGTRNEWAWSVSGASTAQLTAQVINGSWLVQLSVVPAFTHGIIGSQQQSIVGMPPPKPAQIDRPADPLGYPAMSAPATATAITAPKTFQVPADINWGVSRPGYATGTVQCEWHNTLVP